MYLKKLTKGTAEQAHHLNQVGAFSRIPYDDGVALALEGRVQDVGKAHRIIHESLEAFWRQFRKGGQFEGVPPTNAGYDAAMRSGLNKIGLLSDEVDALVELAEKSRRHWKYFDGPGGLPPELPNPIPTIR